MENLPHTSKRGGYLTAEDVGRLAAESASIVCRCSRWRTAGPVGRSGGVAGTEVQFLRRRLSVHDNAVQLGVDHTEGLTNGRQERSVPVPPFVLAELAGQCEGRELEALVFGDGTNYLPRPKPDGGCFAGAVKRAKVQKITQHDLRHTCASIAINSGVNELALSRMLGHTSAIVTLDTYADVFDTISMRSLQRVTPIYRNAVLRCLIGRRAQ